MATGYFTHKDCWLHETGDDHPECPQRLDAIEDRLLVSGVMDVLRHHEAPPASVSELELAHSRQHVAAMHELHLTVRQEWLAGAAGRASVDSDTVFGRHTWNAALRAAGAVVAATDMVVSGALHNAFCAVRPPGHHAGRNKAMGFCFFNNVAIGALCALRRHRLQRVAVVDFDVHHGNGTEDILADEPGAFMAGFFQQELYPFSGQTPAAGNMFNVALPAYTAASRLRESARTHWLAQLEAFRPELIFISAGFDSHRDDDMGQLMLSADDYAWLTAQVLAIAQRHAGGRIVSALEGGYAMAPLAASVEAHVRVLAGL